MNFKTTKQWTEKDNEFLYKICQQLRDNEPFAFSRWGDGEWLTVSLEHIGGENCDGNEYFEDLGKRLSEIVSVKQDYYMGHQNVQGYTLKEQCPQNWVNSDILHEMSEIHGLDYMFELFDSIHVVLIGNESLGKLSFIDEFIEIPYKNVWLDYNNVLDKIKEKIDEDEHKTFLFAAGMCSEVFIHDLWNLNKNNTYMDIGSAFDPYVGRKTRTYHHRLKIEEKNYE